MTELVLIAAVARNGIIGRDGGLPWRIPEDMAFFRRATAGCPVIMGRKTWDSLAPKFRPLPGRHNIVVTRRHDWHAAGATVVDGLDAALAAAADAARSFVIGGVQLFAAALPRADELLLTEIDAEVEGDTRFPEFDRRQFVEITRERHRSAAAGLDFAFVRLRRA